MYKHTHRCDKLTRCVICQKRHKARNPTLIQAPVINISLYPHEYINISLKQTYVVIQQCLHLEMHESKTCGYA
jgi:hypothetical protein